MENWSGGYSLELGIGSVLDTPDADRIRAALRALPGGVDSFAVLSHTDAGSDFLQAAGGPDEPWIVEYQEGGITGHHRAIEPLTVDEVANLFVAFAAGDAGWRGRLRWEQVDLGASDEMDAGASAMRQLDAVLEALDRGADVDSLDLGGDRWSRPAASVSTEVLVEGGPGSKVHHLGLSAWWLDTFSAPERRRILQTVVQGHGWHPGDVLPHPLAADPDVYSSQDTRARFVGSLSGWFSRGAETWCQSVAERLIAECVRLGEESGDPQDVLAVHFAHGTTIGMHYRRRDADPRALELAVAACEKQIAWAPRAAAAFRASFLAAEAHAELASMLSREARVALPVHEGYHQLIIIREKQGDHAEALRLSRKAQAAGWRGRPDADWSRRIARLERRVGRGQSREAL